MLLSANFNNLAKFFNWLDFNIRNLNLSNYIRGKITKSET